MKYITLQLSTNQTTMASIINNSQKSCYKNKFKIAAVALAEKPGYSNRKAARELGIAESNIRMWKKVLPDISAAPRSKCITKSRRGAKWSNIEKRMRDYIDDNVRGNALHKDTTTEVDDPREPYSDEIPQDIWQELLDDVDDNDDDSDTEN